jgi:AcrR family transcriptional regulator
MKRRPVASQRVDPVSVRPRRSVVRPSAPQPLEAKAERAHRGRPRSKQSEDAIINATTELLTREGYARLTLSKVAARARASKSTIYRRWPTKEHLVIEAFNRWPPLVPRDRGDLLSDLLDLYRQSLRVLYRPPSNAIMPALIAERARNPSLAAVFDPVMRRRREPVRIVLNRAIERKELPRGTDVELAVDALMGASYLRMYFVSGDLSVKGMRKMFAMLLRGFGARGHSS